MAEYVTNLDPSTLATVKEELAKRELQQKRHYFLLSELQSMARELPGKYQQRMSYDLLSSLASAVLDGTVFEIVQSLQEVQQLEEKSLFSQRTKLINEHKAQRLEMKKRHREAVQDIQFQNKAHNLLFVKEQNEREWEVMEKRCDDEIKRKDMKIILELDGKVMEQQSTLEKAGVPGFFVTNKPHEIRLQMYLLDFLYKLSKTDVSVT
ncbi:LOW QUALITY PROTEIN: protein DGCR6-like [Liolophura sinensis]|uniref:LOW QUALITY PROTEIN: protein DGCR6-like n=1 Tax=Liolophura sinensis TaxID=3198878 RepID=UPI0031597EAE